MTQMLKPAFVHRIIREKGFNIKKSLGQNFLIDGNIARRIVDSAELQQEDWVLEIGPGLGALTALMEPVCGQVIALEIDRELVTIMQDLLDASAAKIIMGDALALDWRAILEQQGWKGEPLKLVANLPYYLTSPLIMKALESDLPFEMVVVMVQREVARRILAPPGGADYGVLSLAVQYYTEGELLLNVPRTVFIPSPAVDSAVVKLKPVTPKVDAPREQLFAVIRAAFQQRRKTLRNALTPLVEEWGLTRDDLDAALAAAQIDAQIRGERLSLEEFSALTTELLKGV